MPFPDKKGFIFKLPDGWKDLGRKKETHSEKGNLVIYKVHKFCGNRVRIGKEGENLFTYCPVCMVITKDE